MQVTEVKKSRIPKLLKVKAIVLYPFIFYADENPSPTLIAHEWVHVAQIRAVGFFRFYISYLLFYWAFRVVGLRSYKAYRAIPWEAEAFGDIPKGGFYAK